MDRQTTLIISGGSAGLYLAVLLVIVRRVDGSAAAGGRPDFLSRQPAFPIFETGSSIPTAFRCNALEWQDSDVMSRQMDGRNEKRPHVVASAAGIAWLLLLNGGKWCRDRESNPDGREAEGF